jgi:hypothetical protein
MPARKGISGRSSSSALSVAAMGRRGSELGCYLIFIAVLRHSADSNRRFAVAPSRCLEPELEGESRCLCWRSTLSYFNEPDARS